MYTPPARPRRVAALTAALAVGLALLLSPLAGANQDDIRAHCDGNQPVVTNRPSGTEHVNVVCRNGLPEFLLGPLDIPSYDPTTQPLPLATPPDFGGWVTLWLNNQTIIAPFDPVRGVQEPGPYVTASTNRVMIPVRLFTEAFGGEVTWVPQQQGVQLALPDRSRRLTFWVDRQVARVNGMEEKLDQPAVLFQDRTFVPVRFLAEGFGAAVEWDGANQRAMIYMNRLPCNNEQLCGEVN